MTLDKVFIELFKASEPPIEDLEEHLKQFDGENRFDPTNYKIHMDKWSEIMDEHTEDMNSDEKLALKFQAMNIGPSMYK